MRVFLVLLVLGCLPAGRVTAQEIAPSVPEAQCDESRHNCGGVFHCVDNGVSDRYPHSDDYWTEDFGVFVLRMSTSLPREDFDYVRDLLDAVVPSMVEVLGPPVTLDTLLVELSPDIYLQNYNSALNRIQMDPIRPSGDTGTEPSWDNLFIHELTHAFQDDILSQWDFPSWLIEGMAEAARFFVSEAATEASGRDVRYRTFDNRMAVYDLYNNAGEQVLGGSGKLAYRVDLDVLYQNAAGAVIIPALAQIAAGLESPHPLARLTEELRAELDASPPHQIYEAIDRAWSAPVDGVPGPSRWMRTRSVVCPSVRDGEFAALVPYYRNNNLNPARLRILHFARSNYEYEYCRTPSALHFFGVNGWVTTTHYDQILPPVPELPEGAYMAELETSGQDGQTLTARTYLLVVDPVFVGELLWDGVAVVFVDENGMPVDIPPGALSVNGRITARVPGGVIALPYAGTLGDLTFMRDGHPIGTVTATGSLPRLVVLPVEEPPRPVVEWRPYHPVRGDTVEVNLVIERSSLDPLGDEPVEALLYDAEWKLRDRIEMHTVPGGAEIYSARIPIPVDLSYGVLGFRRGDSVHQGCWVWGCEVFWGYEFETRAEPIAELIRCDFDGSSLVVTFEGVVDVGRLLLQTSPEREGPWTDLTGVEAVQSEAEVRWNVIDFLGEGAYFRLVRTGGMEYEVLLVRFIQPAPQGLRLTAREPFPNPSHSTVYWFLEVTDPTRARLEVYDAAGRRIYSGAEKDIYPGTEVLRWKGEGEGGAVGPGVYFLRLVASGREFRSKIVVLR